MALEITPIGLVEPARKRRVALKSVGADAVGPDAVGANAVGPDAVGADAVGADTIGANNRLPGLITLVEATNQSRIEVGSKEARDMAPEQRRVGAEETERRSKSAVPLVGGVEKTVVSGLLLGLLPGSFDRIEVRRVGRQAE